VLKMSAKTDASKKDSRELPSKEQGLFKTLMVRVTLSRCVGDCFRKSRGSQVIGRQISHTVLVLRSLAPVLRNCMTRSSTRRP
jgi:hypothetical protein